MTENEILQFAIENGMIDVTTIQSAIEMKQRQEFLDMHDFKFWQDTKGYWRTYLPTKDGKRKLIKKKKRSDVEDIIIEHYKSKTDDFRGRFDLWVERQQNCGRSENTIYKYKKDYNRFFAGFPIEKMKVQDIDEEVISKHIKESLSKNPIPYKSLQGMFGYMIGTFKKCIKDKIIKENPCDYVDLELFRKYCKKSVGKNSKERTLSDSERQVLYEKLENPRTKNYNYIVHKAVELALYTGMRVGEIAGLYWSAIDYENNFIIIDKSEKRSRETGEYSIEETKNFKIRFFPLTQDIKDILDKVREYQIENDCIGERVFRDKDGDIHAGRISSCARNCTESKEFYNKKSIHAIRRTFNSNMRCNGVSATVSASLLGHTERVNENNYTYDVEEMNVKREYIELAGKIEK